MREATCLQNALELMPVVIGGRRWRMWCVKSQEHLLSLSENFVHPPYGLLLWESAVALAEHMVEVPETVAHKRVLELGAGVGLPGLVARTLGAQVWQTDQLNEALALAALNAHENEVAGVHQFPGDWANWVDEGRYDVILGADILYETAAHAALAAIIDTRLTPDGRMVFADPGRPQAMEFLGKMEDVGARFEVEVRKVAPTCLLSSGEEMEVLLVRSNRRGRCIAMERETRPGVDPADRIRGTARWAKRVAL